MARLAQLLAAHGSILVLDAVSTRVQTGLLRGTQAPLWEQSDEEAGRGLFHGVETLLTKARADIGEVGAFVFCEGPGSMLGTRTVAMALRTWLALKARPVFAYQSLALAARAEWRRAPRPFSLIADARRESWHLQPVAADGALSALERRATAELPAGEGGAETPSDRAEFVTSSRYTPGEGRLPAAGHAPELATRGAPRDLGMSEGPRQLPPPK